MKLFGTAYVILPFDLDRTEYIKHCMSNSTLSIETDNSEVIHNVRVVRGVLDYIEFPNSSKELGSFVVYDYVYRQYPIVVGVLPKDNELENRLEKQFVLNKETIDNTVDITGDAVNSILSVLVKAKSKNSKLYVKVTNDQETSEFSLDVQGIINLLSNKFSLQLLEQFNIKIFDRKNKEVETLIKYILGEGFSYSDEFGNKLNIKDKEILIENDSKDGEIALKSKKFMVNDGEEPLVLGNKLNSNLSDLIDQIKYLVQTLQTIATTDTVAANSYGLTYASVLSQSVITLLTNIDSIKNRLEEHLSEISYTD